MEYIVVNGYPSASQIETALDEDVPEVDWNEPPSLEPGDSADPGGEGEGEGAGGALPDTYAGPWGGGPAPADGAGVASPYGGCSASVAAVSGQASSLFLAVLLTLGFLRRRA